MTEHKNNLMFFPRNREEIEEYTENILKYTLKTEYETEKLILFAFINLMFGIEMPTDEICPRHLLYLLQQTATYDQNGVTPIDKLFTAATEYDADQDYQQLYWYLKDTDNFVPAVVRLISIFQFYDNLFPNPVYADSGKSLIYYPKNKREDMFEIPNGVTKIYPHVFSQNPYLEIIKIPETVMDISTTTITSCPSLTSFIVDENNPVFYSEFGILYKDRDNPVLVKYPSGIDKTSITIPKYITEVSPFAFEKCQNLTELILESHETVLNDNAFFNCTNLEIIVLLDGHNESLNHCAFEGSLLGSPTEDEDEDAKSQIPQSQRTTLEYHTPSEINKMFDDYIVGHKEAKKTLSVAVYSHIMRCNNPSKQIGKSNILLCGPTGCGKTEFARTIAKCLNVPFITIDATSVTETGMKGNDPTDMLKDLLIASNNNLELAQNGIIYIDEIDKLATFGENSYRESYSKGVQQGLLKIVEGGIIPIRNDDPFNPTTINFDTSNVLFIAGGAFGGITSPNKADKKPTIGFTETTSSNNVNTPSVKKLDSQDFVKYGMTEELIGRFPVIVQLQPLTEDEIYRIMTEPKNSVVEQYKKLVHCIGSELNFDEELLHKIASDAMKTGTGARGLRTVIEKLVENILYELPDKTGVKKVVVHKGMLDNQEPAKYVLTRPKSKRTTNSPRKRNKQSPPSTSKSLTK